MSPVPAWHFGVKAPIDGSHSMTTSWTELWQNTTARVSSSPRGQINQKIISTDQKAQRESETRKASRQQNRHTGSFSLCGPRGKPHAHTHNLLHSEMQRRTAGCSISNSYIHTIIKYFFRICIVKVCTAKSKDQASRQILFQINVLKTVLNSNKKIYCHYKTKSWFPLLQWLKSDLHPVGCNLTLLDTDVAFCVMLMHFNKVDTLSHTMLIFTPTPTKALVAECFQVFENFWTLHFTTSFYLRYSGFEQF